MTSKSSLTLNLLFNEANDNTRPLETNTYLCHVCFDAAHPIHWIDRYTHLFLYVFLNFYFGCQASTDLLTLYTEYHLSPPPNAVTPRYPSLCVQ